MRVKVAGIVPSVPDFPVGTDLVGGKDAGLKTRATQGAFVAALMKRSLPMGMERDSLRRGSGGG